jgi:hypothetical protein
MTSTTTMTARTISSRSQCLRVATSDAIQWADTNAGYTAGIYGIFGNTKRGIFCRTSHGEFVHVGAAKKYCTLRF